MGRYLGYHDWEGDKTRQREATVFVCTVRLESTTPHAYAARNAPNTCAIEQPPPQALHKLARTPTSSRAPELSPPAVSRPPRGARKTGHLVSRPCPAPILRNTIPTKQVLQPGQWCYDPRSSPRARRIYLGHTHIDSGSGFCAGPGTRLGDSARGSESGYTRIRLPARTPLRTCKYG